MRFRFCSEFVVHWIFPARPAQIQCITNSLENRECTANLLQIHHKIMEPPMSSCACTTKYGRRMEPGTILEQSWNNFRYKYLFIPRWWVPENAGHGMIIDGYQRLSMITYDYESPTNLKLLAICGQGRFKRNSENEIGKISRAEKIYNRGYARNPRINISEGSKPLED